MRPWPARWSCGAAGGWGPDLEVRMATVSGVPEGWHRTPLVGAGRQGSGGEAVDAVAVQESSLCEETPADDVLHHLDRPTTDAGHAGVDVGAGDRELDHVAPAAEELQALVHDPAL